MKKLVLKILTILAAFFLGIFCMSYMLSVGNRDLTDSMASATLPMVYMEQNGQQLNLMEPAAWIHAEFVKIHPFPDGNVTQRYQQKAA